MEESYIPFDVIDTILEYAPLETIATISKRYPKISERRRYLEYVSAPIDEDDLGDIVPDNVTVVTSGEEYVLTIWTFDPDRDSDSIIHINSEFSSNGEKTWNSDGYNIGVGGDGMDQSLEICVAYTCEAAKLKQLNDN